MNENLQIQQTYQRHIIVLNVPQTNGHLRGTVSVLEIVFVGQCEVFVCLNFVLTLFFPWLRSS